jgi:hypothetical protein
MRTSFAAGVVEEDRLLLLPVDEVSGWALWALARWMSAGCVVLACLLACLLKACTEVPPLPLCLPCLHPSSPGVWFIQALQLRPSLAHLDKEKEQSAAKKKSAAAAAEEEDAKPAEMLQQLTVQVKRRETEQQTEARLRSYAHLAAQEEADQWVPLDFYGANSGERLGRAAS